MELIRGLQGLREKHRGAAITVGSYDGIHLGHGALIASACGIAKQLARPRRIVVFEVVRPLQGRGEVGEF